MTVHVLIVSAALKAFDLVGRSNELRDRLHDRDVFTKRYIDDP